MFSCSFLFFFLVFGFRFFVCLFVCFYHGNVVGTLLSGLLCILANNWQNFLVLKGGGDNSKGGTYVKERANSNVSGTCVPFTVKAGQAYPPKIVFTGVMN